MSLKKLKNHTSRNGFDLSKRNIFSAKVGELLPVYCKEVIPGDKFKINVKSFTRTMPVNTAAYTRIKEYYDWFFVPTNLLWNKFNTWVTQMTDNTQHADSLLSTMVLGSSHPYFTTDQVFDYLKAKDNLYKRYEDGGLSVGGNMFGFNEALLSAKLLHYLGYPNFNRSSLPLRETSTGQFAENVALNPFPLLAYQKIYSDYYRDSQWERADASSFNLDYMSGGGDLNIPINSASILPDLLNSENMFTLRYASWNKDLFMGVKPNSQFGDAASVMLSTSDGGWPSPIADSTSRWNTMNDANINQDTQIYARMNGDITTYSNNSPVNQFFASVEEVNQFRRNIGLPQYNADDVTQSVVGVFSILALRQAEALQKWKEITQSQQQDYKSQIEAHFGVSLSDAYSERCHYVDGFSDVIDINEVVNTNLVNGDVQQIADIAGKGVGVNDGYTSFSSDVHGYLMCIYHAVPLLDYALETRIPRQMQKTQVTDYAIPELDKTGMVSVPFVEMSNDSELNDGRLIGYAPRYYDYKTDVDEIHGSALNKNSAWVAPFNDEYLKMLLFPNGDASQALNPITYKFFKVNPSVLDPVFAGPTQSDSSVDSDQLLTNCSFDVKAVRNLDYDGLPY